VNVSEFAEVSLTSENLAATDNDTDDRLLNFILVKLPEFGEIRVGPKKVDQFSQGELLDGRVRYVHTGKEIGRSPIKDIVTFTVLDQSPPAAAETIPLIDLEVTVEPVDNSPPELLVGGPLLVQEGKAACITADIVSARDVDSQDEALLFVVAQTPMWGFLERSKGTSRSGRSQTSRRISSFTLSDLRDGTVLYVPSNLSKGSPPSDSFFIYCTDGQNHSPLSQIEISVLPPNIKLPDFELANIVVDEGGEIAIRVQMTGDIGGRQKNSEVSTLSVATPPLHGELILARSEPQKGTKEVRFHEVAVEDLEGPEVQLIYRHDGSESKDDRFALSLSEGIHVVKRTCMVVVLPVNDAKPALLRAGPLYVDYGGTRLITNSVLKAVDDDSRNSDIYFIIVTTPRKGTIERQVVSGGSDGSEWIVLETGNNFTQAAIDDNLVRYTHTTELGESTGDKFLFSVTDSAYTLSGLSFLIEISRMSPRRILLHNRIMSLKDGEQKTICSDDLKADDGGKQPLDIIFTVSEYPMHGTLGLSGGQANTTEVRQFTQLDLNEKSVFYRHDNTKPGFSTFEDKMTLVITSSRLIVAPMIAVFKFTILTDDQFLPSLITNIPLTIIQGTTTNIPSANLLVAQRNGSTSTTTGNLAYIVVERPKHGQLLIRGFPVTGSFTQLDIDARDVDYASDDSDDSMTDYFLFTVTDTSRHRHDVGYLVNETVHRRPAFFNILIQPVTKEPPKLVMNRSPENLISLGNGKSGFLITGEHLKATHPFFSSEDITFTIKDAPRSGTLEYSGTGRPARKRLTQKELDEGRIAYALNERPLGAATSENFTFRVQDGNRNTLDDQR